MPVVEEYPPTVVRPASPAVRMRDLLQISRPHFWFLSVVAIHLGFVLATHRIVPRGDEIVAVGNAALVAGPLLWLAVLSVNDARDLTNDRANPRKAGSPLVLGKVTSAQLVRVGVLASGLTVLAAVPLGGLFTTGTAVAVLLGWAYSTPPLQLKARAGADVVVNSLVVGVMGPLGGWVATTGTIGGYPWPISIVGVLAVAGLYLPTTLVDLEADHRVGVRTTAVALGRRATFEIGFALWAGSAVLSLGLALAGVVIDPGLVPLHAIITPVLLVLYRVLLREPSSFGAVLVVAGTYAVPCAAFVLTYVESL
ncbi:MAG TPA: UbiA prenyltransferase family protein [Jiangellales bacterium]|nr:UbiA prenyltransferase family protein [Jiangellales bacterium]